MVLTSGEEEALVTNAQVGPWWLVLRGLKAIGEDMCQDWILRGMNWLESCQNGDGGWGETCATYDNPKLKGQGESTPSQTAWALMGIIAASDHLRPSMRHGVEYLHRTQSPDGSWAEDHITGTGFPKVFYLKYDMYRNSWPLLALATYRNLLPGAVCQQPTSVATSAEPAPR